jgi:hypothetical protein
MTVVARFAGNWARAPPDRPKRSRGAAFAAHRGVAKRTSPEADPFALARSRMTTLHAPSCWSRPN